MRSIASSVTKLICRRAVVAGMALAALATAATVAPAQEPAAPTTAPATDRIAAGGGGDAGQVRRLTIRAGESRVIDAPWPVKRLSVTDPATADVDLTSPRVVQVSGKAPGTTEVILWSERGDVWQAVVEVEADVSRLQNDLRKMFPDSTLEAQQIGKIIMVKGALTRVDEVPQLHRFFELSKLEFVDATKVAGVQQVQLKVKVAEVSRTAVRALSSD